MLIMWIQAFVLIMVNKVFSEAPVNWTHYEKNYTGGCHSDENSKSPCFDLGEHAFKGSILDEPPKGAKFYLEDLEPFVEDYLPSKRERRSSKRKGSKHLEKASHDIFEDNAEGKDDDDDDDDDEEEEEEEEREEEDKIRSIKKANEKKKGNKKKIEKPLEKEYEEDEENEEEKLNEEGTESAENVQREQDKQVIIQNKRIK